MLDAREGIANKGEDHAPLILWPRRVGNGTGPPPPSRSGVALCNRRAYMRLTVFPRGKNFIPLGLAVNVSSQRT
jgi:hypothetical protein